MIARHTAVDLQGGAEALDDPDASMHAIDALQRKLLAGMLGPQFRRPELETGPETRFDQARLQRHVGRVREFTPDAHVAGPERERPVEQAVARLGRRREARGVAALRVGDFAAHVQRAGAEQPQVSADQPVTVDRLLRVDRRYADAQRVERQPVPDQLAHVERDPGAGHEMLFRSARRLERHHDEHGIAVRVSRRDRLLEEHDAGGVIDLVIHKPDHGLGLNRALRIRAIARLDAYVFRARHHVGGQLIRPGNARASQLELMQRLRGHAAECAPGEGASRHMRRHARYRPSVLGEAEAAREAARREVAERGPVVPSLETSREPGLRRGALLLGAGVAENRVLRFLQRIGAAVERVAPVVQPARVEPQRERGARVEAAASGERPIRVRRRPGSDLTGAGHREPAYFGKQLERHSRRRIARLDLQLTGAHDAPGSQLDRQAAGRGGEQLQSHGRSIRVQALRLGAFCADGHVGGLRDRHTPTVHDAHVHHGGRTAVGGERQRASALGNLESGGQAGHVNGDAVPTFLAPRILHGDAQAVRATGERHGDEVEDAVNPGPGRIDQRGAIVQHDRDVRLALDADVDAVSREHGAVARREDLNSWTSHGREELLGGLTLRAAPGMRHDHRVCGRDAEHGVALLERGPARIRGNGGGGGDAGADRGRRPLAELRDPNGGVHRRRRALHRRADARFRPTRIAALHRIFAGLRRPRHDAHCGGIASLGRPRDDPDLGAGAREGDGDRALQPGVLRELRAIDVHDR